MNYHYYYHSHGNFKSTFSINSLWAVSSIDCGGIYISRKVAAILGCV